MSLIPPENLRELLEAEFAASPVGVLFVDAGGIVAAHNDRLLEPWRIPNGTSEAANSSDALLNSVSELVEDWQRSWPIAERSTTHPAPSNTAS